MQSKLQRARAAALDPYTSSLAGLLLIAREAVMARYRPVLRQHGVTEQQWRVLRTLSGGGALEAAELAKRAFLRPPSLSRILRDLESRRLIERGQADHDLRRSVVEISKRGLALIEEVTPESLQATAEIERLVGARKLRQLRELLHELESALGGCDEPEE